MGTNQLAQLVGIACVAVLAALISAMSVAKPVQVADINTMPNREASDGVSTGSLVADGPLFVT